MNSTNLPDGWELKKLLDICDVKTGKVDANHHSDNGQYDFFTCAIEPLKSETYSFDGDLIILPGNGANVGHVQFYSGKIEAYQRTYVLHNFIAEPKFVYFHLLSQWKIRNEYKQFGSATNYIRLGNFEDYELEIPLLPEQKRIAQKFTTLLDEVAKVKTHLEKIPMLLKTFRQSVLARAVSGELSAKWREENGVGLDSWEKGTIKNFVEKPVYGSSAKSQKEGRIPVLRMGNIQSGKLDWTDLVFSSNEEEIKKYRLEKYDILFNRTNSPELVGKTAIYLAEKEAIFAGYLIRVRCREILNPHFLNYHLNSPFAKNYCLEVKSDGVSQSNINAQKLLAYPICLPTIEEQNYITQTVKTYLDFADQIESQVQQALERVNLMTQAILAKGFRGELC